MNTNDLIKITPVVRDICLLSACFSGFVVVGLTQDSFPKVDVDRFKSEILGIPASDKLPINEMRPNSDIPKD